MFRDIVGGAMVLVVLAIILALPIEGIRRLACIVRGRDPLPNGPFIGGLSLMLVGLVSVMVMVVAPYNGLKEGEGELFYIIDRVIIFVLTLSVSLLIARISRIIINRKDRRALKLVDTSSSKSTHGSEGEQ